MLVTYESNLADFDFSSLPDHEGKADRSRRNGTYLGANGGELTPVFRQQIFNRDFRFFHSSRVILAFDRQSDFALLKAIENVAGRDRAQAHVIDFANGGPFFDVDVNDPTFGRLLTFESDVLEVSCIPQ